jgi:hypothetical protein
MKKISLLITGILFFATLHAQDIITLKNGTQLKGKVTDVSITDIKYKKAGSADSTTYVISKSDVLVIDYQDGSTLILNTLTPKDQAKLSENFPQRIFFSIGGCLDFQIPQNYIYKPKLDFYPNISLGVKVSRRVTFEVEANYQVISYNRSESEPLLISYQGINSTTEYHSVLSATQYSINSSNSVNTNMFLIPNIIITANQHKFTPYAKMGAILLLNKTVYSDNSVNYNNGVITSGTPYESTSTYPINVGILLAGGSTLQLSKHILIFGELYVKGILPTSSTNGLLLEINAPAFGVNAGLNIAL